MRKLILTVTVAILTSGVSVFAANNITNNNSDEIIVVVANDDFKEITKEELPEAVTNAVAKDFSTATIAKAYVNGSEQYKIQLTIDETEGLVYLDKEGTWLKDTDIVTVNEKESVSVEK